MLDSQGLRFRFKLRVELVTKLKDVTPGTKLRKALLPHLPSNPNQDREAQEDIRPEKPALQRQIVVPPHQMHP
jgi:hypothetical protein